MSNEPVAITSTDFWFKVVEMLQQNWALIDRDVQGLSCIVFFVSDASGVFDRMRFASEAEAIAALRRNGFARYAASAETQRFVAAPTPPFHEAMHPNGPIYSSGRFWKQASVVSLDVVLAEARKNRRVCPLPTSWHALYEQLPDKRRGADGREPANPLILGGWFAPAHLKMLRLQEHIEWAASHGTLDAVHAFLCSLPESDWLHLDKSD